MSCKYNIHGVYACDPIKSNTIESDSDNELMN